MNRKGQKGHKGQKRRNKFSLWSLVSFVSFAVPFLRNPMSSEKATALVLRTTDWSESSRIATLWTREFGKVRALAKGGRRLKAHFENALDLLTLCRIVFLRKSSDSLDLLTEAQVIQRFPRLRTDLTALYAAYYVAELLAEGTRDYDPHPLLFDEALDALQTLGGVPPHPSPPPQGGRE